MKKICTILVPLLLIVATVVPSFAGGPLGAVGATPRKYAPGAFPLVYRADLGGLGTFSNGTAVTIANYAFTQWDNVVSAAMSFTNGGFLARDVVLATDAYISGAGQFSDGVNPIVFDSSGAITDARYGVGAKNSVLGFAGSAYAGTSYTEGFAVINGFLSGPGAQSNQDEYKATMTHEIGHLLGLAHPQTTMHANYATMYPYVLSNNQRFLTPDDTAAIAELYPAAGYAATVGKISGTVRRPNNANLSGVNVVAVDSATGAAYSTVVDYFSGGTAPYTTPPAATGVYTIAGLPPGKYYVRIEGVNTYFTGGSNVASYSPPINTTVAREWFNGGFESGDMLTDNTNDHTAITVTGGATVTGVNFISNESATTSTISYHSTNITDVFSIPSQPSGTVQRYATRFTAPSLGSLVGVKVRIMDLSTMPTNGTLTIAVYTNSPGGIAGIPGTSLGSVTIPFTELAADQENEIYLRGIGGSMNFLQSTDFHIALSSNAVGAVYIPSDNGTPLSNRSSYYTPVNMWRNMGQGTYTTGYNLMLTALYSNVTVGVPAPAASAVPSLLQFGRKRPGQMISKSVSIRNTGIANLTVTGTAITGPDATEFTILSGGGAYTVAPGDSHAVMVQFAPQNASGDKSASLVVTSNDANSPLSVPLLGAGVRPFATTLSPTIIFPPTRVGQSSTVDTLVMRNTGNDTLRVSGAFFSGPDGGKEIKFVSGQGVRLIPPDSTLRMKLSFAPTEHRAYSATITVNDDDTVNATVIQVEGIGTSPVVSPADSTITFAPIKVGTTELDTLYIHNTGDAPLSVTSLAISGGDAACFQIVSAPTLPLTLAPGDSLPIVIRFSPTMRRLCNATLTINHDATPTSNSYTLIGRGTSGVLAPESNTFSLGATKIGRTNHRGLRITNPGDAPLSITALMIDGTNGADFAIDSPAVSVGSPLILQPGDSGMIYLRFTPSALGARSGRLTMTNNGVTTPVMVDLSGGGLEGSLILGSTKIDFGTVYLDSTKELDFWISNIETAPVTLDSTSLSGTGFSLVNPPSNGVTVAPGDTIRMKVRFAPVGTTGDYTGALKLSSEGKDFSVELVGIGAVKNNSGVEGTTIVTGGMSISLQKIIPNPAVDRATVGVNLRGSGTVQASISLRDTRGATLLEIYNGLLHGTGGSVDRLFQLDVRGLPAGEYFVVMATPSGMRTLPLVIAR